MRGGTKGQARGGQKGEERGREGRKREGRARQERRREEKRREGKIGQRGVQLDCQSLNPGGLTQKLQERGLGL